MQAVGDRAPTDAAAGADAAYGICGHESQCLRRPSPFAAACETLDQGQSFASITRRLMQRFCLMRGGLKLISLAGHLGWQCTSWSSLAIVEVTRPALATRMLVWASGCRGGCVSTTRIQPAGPFALLRRLEPIAFMCRFHCSDSDRFRVLRLSEACSTLILEWICNIVYSYEQSDWKCYWRDHNHSQFSFREESGKILGETGDFESCDNRK